MNHPSNRLSIRIGTEHGLGHRLSAIATLGLYRDGYYIKAGLKRYASTRDGNAYYFELNTYFYKVAYNETDNYYDTTAKATPAPGPEFYYHVNKQVYGANIEIGWLQNNGHLSFEWFVGGGLRVRTGISSVTDSVENLGYHFHEGMTMRFADINADHALLPSLSLGIRLGYCYPKRDNYRSIFTTWRK